MVVTAMYPVTASGTKKAIARAGCGTTKIA